VRNTANGRELLSPLEPVSGTPRIRNIFDQVKGRRNQYWNRRKAVENRCVVPFASFSEFDGTMNDGKKRGDTWLALDESRPLAFFAGIWVEGWTSVRKIKTGIETADYFSFMTSEPTTLWGPSIQKPWLSSRPNLHRSRCGCRRPRMKQSSYNFPCPMGCFISMLCVSGHRSRVT
jgi:hypothetical protein